MATQTNASDSLASLQMLATAISGRDLQICETDSPCCWTDGVAIHLSNIGEERQLMQLCAQSALIAAGSLDYHILKKITRRTETAKRYLAIETHRALTASETILPPRISGVIDRKIASLSSSPTQSLDIAKSKIVIRDNATLFGELRPRAVLAKASQTGAETQSGQHIPRQQADQKLVELPEDANEESEDQYDAASSPIGGGGGLGKLMQRMFQMVRRVEGGDTPGADAPTHWTRSGSRSGVNTIRSSAKAETVDDAFGKGSGILYPEWNAAQQAYRLDWCTVTEIDPPADTPSSVDWLGGASLRKPLSRLGMGLDNFHRQSQGDDLDIDAVIEAHIELMAGSAPEESVYIESQRHRRDLSVMILLDISGSVSQPGQNGKSVHDQQREVAAALMTVLFEIGDRTALYGFHSQGRTAVKLIPVKRFEQNLDSGVISRLFSLKPGAYSRLGAAIRHSTTIMLEQSGTPRKLLVVLSDGLAYDHGYEPDYGAADSRQALAEARKNGVGCLCLSIGANTDAQALKQVFGSASYASIPDPKRLGQVIGPLFQAALRAAEVQRKAA